MEFWVMNPSLKQMGSVQEDLNQLLDEHSYMIRLPVSDPRRLDHYKRFVRNFVEALCMMPDGTLFSLLRASSLYPEDVLNLAKGRWRNSVMSQALIKANVMDKWSTMIYAMKLPFEKRNYIQYPDLLRFFASGVRRLVGDISFHDGTLVSVLKAARSHPLDVQEMACTRWKDVVMGKVFLDEKIMYQWYCMIRLQMLPDTERDSILYRFLTKECAQITMEWLALIPDADKICKTLWHFPTAAVYSTLIVHADQFRERFSFLGVMIYSLNEIALSLFAPDVWRLVEDVRFNDGTICPVLKGAQWHSLVVQKSACVDWKHIVMERTLLSKKTMGQWDRMIDVQELAIAEQGSKKYEECATVCSRIIMRVLDPITDIEELRKTLRIFPPAAVYSTIATHRIRFSNRFSALKPTPEMWKRTVKGWSKSVSHKGNSLDAWIWDTDRIYYMALKIAKHNKALREKHAEKCYRALAMSGALRFNIPAGSNLSQMLLGKTPSECLAMAVYDTEPEEREVSMGDKMRNYTARMIRTTMVHRITSLVSRFGVDAIKKVKAKNMVRVRNDVLSMDRPNLNHKKRLEIRRFRLLTAAYNARNRFLEQ